MSINTTSNKKESYKLEIKLADRVVLERSYEHNRDGINQAFQGIAELKPVMAGLMLSALIISSRDDVVYDEDFNVPLATR